MILQVHQIPTQQIKGITEEQRSVVSFFRAKELNAEDIHK
jgi:hypothetical protein